MQRMIHSVLTFSVGFSGIIIASQVEWELGKWTAYVAGTLACIVGLILMMSAGAPEPKDPNA